MWSLLLILPALFLPIVTCFCAYDWTLHNRDTCYHHNTTAVTFEEAQQSCHSLNATLPSIHSMHDNNYVFDLMERRTSWIGLVSNHSVDNHRVWYWTDNKPVNLELWTRGGFFDQIVSGCSTDCCVTFMDPDGMWSHVDCNDTSIKHGFVCYRHVDRSQINLQGVEDTLDQLVSDTERLQRQLDSGSLTMSTIESQLLVNYEVLQNLKTHVDRCFNLIVVVLTLLVIIVVCAVIFASVSSHSCATKMPSYCQRLLVCRLSHAMRCEEEELV